MLAGRAKSLLSNNGKLLSLLRYSSSKSTKDYVDNQQLDGNPLEGFKSREHEFYRARSHDIMPRTAEELAEQDVSDRVLRKEEQQELEKYEQHSTVSLRGVMQSNVPEPFNPMGRNPTHLNMPGGGIKLEQKYVSDILQKVHPSKQFSTSARHQNQAADMNIPSYTDIPCPQGVQGYDCIEFKLWLKNCQRHDLNCDQMIDDFETGRKTLAQIFVEQDELIRSVVAQRTNTSGFIGHEGIQSIPLPARRQGPGLKEEFVQGIQTDFKRHYSTSSGGSHEVSKDNVNADQPLTQRQKLKRAVKEYGATVVVFHVGISLMSLGGFYLAVSSGIDMVSLLSKVGVGEKILESGTVTGASTFVVAYAVHKVFAPVRIGITLTCTPFIVRHLRKIGFLKVPKS